jgi:hypothetical protein
VSDVWKKLNLKDQSEILVLDSPAGFEGVRQMAIDEAWSALRLRRSEYFKKMTRDENRAMTKKGKAKTGKM